MYVRALLVWCALLLLAIGNGALREALLEPRFGRGTGHVVSTVSLSAVVAIVTCATIRWIGPPNSPSALTIGCGWLVLTVAFEFFAGHYLFKHSWNELIADYNVLRGRIWLLVPVTLAVAPWLAARARGILQP